MNIITPLTAAARGFIFGLAVTFLIETLNNEYEFINKLSQTDQL